MCPENLVYTKDHEWARVEEDIAMIGITEYAQDQLCGASRSWNPAYPI
jgi:glycine cleavage system H lipoate-binding protein